MIDVKKNFRSMYSDTSCNLCDRNEPQTQSHLLSCSAIIEKCSELSNDTQIKYSNLYLDVDRQRSCAQLFAKILKIKEQLEEDSPQ